MNAAAKPDSTIFILDIDGTLIPTHEMDNTCYWHAVEQVFGRQEQTVHLLNYVHVSDSGILDQWCRETLGRGPEPAETEALRGLFLELVETASRERPELFQPRPGLTTWLESMLARPGTHLAIATGSWGNTARFKLEASGLSRFGLPLATSDDAISRTEIMNAALTRLDLAGLPPEHLITYIGDGPWDWHASCELGWSFIGIADGERADTLRGLGAQQVHADFRPLSNGM